LNLNLAATAVFVALFLFATWLGLVAAHWRKADLNILHEWGLGGRRFGTLITWFLLGGDLYTRLHRATRASVRHRRLGLLRHCLRDSRLSLSLSHLPRGYGPSHASAGM
jgi:hypothetical protein